MLDIKEIILPNGKKYTFYRKDGETWADVITNSVLPLWEDYCNSNWISSNHEDMFCGEKRVKAFLDRCGWLMIKDDLGNVESEYKNKVNKAREIPFTECPPIVGDTMYSCTQSQSANVDADRFDSLISKLDSKAPKVKRKERKKQKTMCDKLDDLRRTLPVEKIQWCNVDADNNFRLGSNRYHIAFDTSGYTRFDEKTGVKAMDRILAVILTDDGIVYYDQLCDPIDVDNIKVI